MPANAAKKAAAVKGKPKLNGSSAQSHAAINSKVQPGPSETHETDESHDSVCDGLVKDNTLTNKSVRCPEPCGTMQLSLKNLTKHENGLPRYPIADTIALLLILINFPRVLVTAMHLFYSYKEYLAPSTETAGIPPFILVATIDILVLGFTYSILPMLRHTITDFAHLMVAVQMSGAKWKVMLPISLIMTVLRSAATRISSLYKDVESQRAGSLLTKAFSRVIPQIFQPLRASTAHFTHLSANPIMDVVQAVVATHVFSLGVIRCAKYWLASTAFLDSRKDSESGITRNIRRGTQTFHDRILPLHVSIWDQILRWKADTNEQLHTVSMQSDSEKSVYVNEIMPRFVSLILQSPDGLEPKASLKVNGLPREAVITPTTSNIHEWSLLIDHLSPRTEYDLDIEIDGINPSQCQLSVCTALNDTKPAMDLLHNPMTVNADSATSVAASCNSTRATPVVVATTAESITASSRKVDENKAILRKLRREHTKRLQTLQKDMDHLATRVTTTNDKNDQRLQGRILSLQTESKRLQESIDVMELEKSELSSKREAQTSIWQAAKDARDREAEVLEQVRQRYDSQKAEHQRKVTLVENESNKVRHKADKLSLRRTKIQQDLDRLANEQDELLRQEQQGRAIQRESIRNQRLQAEADWLKAIHDAQQRAELLELYAK